MDYNANSDKNSLRDPDDSLGIFDINKTTKAKRKFIGNISCDSFKDGNHRNRDDRGITNDRLYYERMKAIETLHKSQNDAAFKRPHPISNKENSKSAINVSAQNSPIQLDHTDYVPFRRPNPINISDLVTDETINLESISSRSSSASKDIKVSFEPTEITGRSTLYNKDLKTSANIVEEDGTVRNSTYKTNHISVSDILASSFAPKARNLCETLQGGDTTLDYNVRHNDGVTSSTANTSTSSFNGYRSLPRTADMSLSKNTCTEESFVGGFNTFSFDNAGASTGVDVSENFAPGELMQSRLINDEISWAQEYAAIPTSALSEQAKAKMSRNSETNSIGFDSSTTTNSIIAGDPNFSVGNFFNIRSDNIWNILKSKSPDKCRTPIALVDEDDNTVTTTSEDIVEQSSKISVTPKIDNKTYMCLGTNNGRQIEKNTSFSKSCKNINHESKDSGNSTDNSYLLSISAIDRALYNLDLQSDGSGRGVSEQLIMQEKVSKTCHTSKQSENSRSSSVITCSKEKSLGNNANDNCSEKIGADDELILENKENLDPETKRSSGAATLCDTASFTESLLNTSDMKNLQRSFNQPRSPLSPIDIRGPNIRISQVDDNGAEADNDEWPDSPITNNRRVRRTKSPRDISPLHYKSKNDSRNETTPVNSKKSGTYTLENKKPEEPKTISSTRLDVEDGSPQGDYELGISANNRCSQHSTSSLIVNNNTSSIRAGRSPRIVSPSLTDNSPISSPRSCNLSQFNSPTPTTLYPSPNLDVTSNSERHLLAAGVPRKVLSSPVGSESSSTYSYGTLQSYRSAMSGGNARSVSRCSSTSEFSHRDGKQIPLKVTNMELSWGSVKLRSDSRKSMQIKNIINKRLVIRIEVSGPGFQIVNSQRSNTITLHSQECRTISICFCPTVRGVAIGKLSFYAPCGAPTIGNSFLDVPLYGYGGNASIIAQNIFIGPVGTPFVTMGGVSELARPLERTISFYNKGPLLGFASITIDSIGLMIPRLNDAFEIHPRRVLIPPKHVVDIRIVFRPKREEIRKIVKRLDNVLTLANIRVICGDEPNRQRIRHLLSRMSEEERCKFSSSSLDMLWTKFPQECEMTDVHKIKENPSTAIDLTSFFRIHEILLTINHDSMDDTYEASSLFLADVDETVLFRTIYDTADSPTPSSNLGTVDEVFEEVNDDHVTQSHKSCSWSVNPTTLVINLNNKTPITLCVSNGFKSRQFFEVACNLKDVLHITPNEGYIPPDGGRTIININLHDNFKYPSENIYIMVYMENERIVVPVVFKK